MTRRGTTVLRLLLVAGLLVVPASGGGEQRLEGSVPEPASGSRISLSALSPAITPPTSEPVGKWIAGRRDHQRTYPRSLALLALAAPLAALVRRGLLRSPGGWRGRFFVTGRTVSSRAPPSFSLA